MSDPSDGGDSEYNIITCVQCSAEVGKVYVRTSQETAKLQDLISLSTDAVCSYQLGRHEMRVQGTGDLNPLSEARHAARGADGQGGERVGAVQQAMAR